MTSTVDTVDGGTRKPTDQLIKVEFRGIKGSDRAIGPVSQSLVYMDPRSVRRKEMVDTLDPVQ